MFYTPSPEPAYYPRHPYPHSSKYYRDDLYSTASSSSSPRSHPQPSMRRSHTVGTPYVPDYDYDYGYDASDAEPFARMPHTYAWVLEQQFADMAKANDETVRWVYAQQACDTLRTQLAHRIVATARRGGFPSWEELLLHHPEARARWAESERRWKRWERDAEDTIEDELQRLQEYRRQTERHRAAYERRRRMEEEKERARREREREAARSRKHEDAGRRYESRWAALLSSSETLGFRDIPWPMFSQPRSLDDISPSKVALFVLSPMHPGETRRDKIRNALKRWHPDRFGRLSSRVEEADKEAIEEGVGIVVRCLNDLLERESQ